MSSVNAKEIRRQDIRLQKLDQARRKLLQMAHSDALPLDLLREEQKQIGTEVTQAEKIKAGLSGQEGILHRNLATSLDYCHQSYLDRDETPKDAISQPRNLVVTKYLGGFISSNIEPRYHFNEHGGWETASIKTRHFGARKRLWINDWTVINASSATVSGSAILLYQVDDAALRGPAVTWIASAILIAFHARMTWNKLCRRPRPTE